jgi:hypothetical protein
MASHKDLGVKSKNHKNPEGCVTRHIKGYRRGNTCSHRWQAGERARAENRIPNYHTNRRGYNYSIELFSLVWWPWSNNAHHIIPRSVLANMLDDVSQDAAPESARMFRLAVNGLLTENYNLNAKINMIMLPMVEIDAARMGLPRHLKGKGGGAFDHPDYSEIIYLQVLGQVVEKYEGFAKAVKAKKHQEKDPDPPQVRTILEGFSEVVYEEIIAVAAAKRAAGETDLTLDSISSALF